MNRNRDVRQRVTRTTGPRGVVRVTRITSPRGGVTRVTRTRDGAGRSRGRRQVYLGAA